MSLTVLDPDEITAINVIMDYILKNPAKTVGTIKKRFRLTEEEYRMIFDLTMPHIRTDSAKSYWKTKYLMLRGQISELVQNNKKSELAPELWSILETVMLARKTCWRSRKRKKIVIFERRTIIEMYKTIALIGIGYILKDRLGKKPNTYSNYLNPNTLEIDFVRRLVSDRRGASRCNSKKI